MAINATIDSIRTQKIDTLNELIAITRDSARFYNDAAKTVENPNLRTLFTDLATSKSGLVEAMSKDVKQQGATPEAGGTVRGSWDRMYGEIRSHFGDKDFNYVKQLESTEDRLLKAFDEVVGDTSVPAPVKQAVSDYLPKIRAQHELMRDRKWEMQAKH